MIDFHPAGADQPKTKIGESGSFESGAWITISGTFLKQNEGDAQVATTDFLPASSRFTQGEPHQCRRSMLTVWADVETAAEFRTFNAPGDYTFALLTQATGEEIAGLDENALYRAGPGGRANHDAAFGRVAPGTLGVGGSLRLATTARAALPDPAVASLGALRMVNDGPDGANIVVSTGTQ